MPTHRPTILVPDPGYHPDDFPSLASGGVRRRAPGHAHDGRCQIGDRADIERRLERLTPREYQEFVLVTGGLLNKEIAELLSILEVTVKAHRQKVMRKLEVSSPVMLGRLAERVRIVLLEPEPESEPQMTSARGWGKKPARILLTAPLQCIVESNHKTIWNQCWHHKWLRVITWRWNVQG